MSRKVVILLAILSSLGLAASLKLVPQTISIAQGKVFPVTVVLNDHPRPNDVIGVSFVLSYNAKILQVVNREGVAVSTVAPSPKFPLFLRNEVDNKTGVIRLALGAETAQSTPVELVTINFKALASGTVKLEWAADSNLGLYLNPFPWEENLVGKSATVVVGNGSGGGGLPSSQVLPLDRYENAAAFPVSWYGTGPNRIVGYHIQFRVDSGPWQDWQEGNGLLFQGTSAIFGRNGSPITVKNGQTIAFRSRAQDEGGFWELLPASPDTETIVDLRSPEIFLKEPLDQALVGGKSMVRWNASDTETDIAYVQLFVDGKLVQTIHSAPFETEVDWSVFVEGNHRLILSAADLAGNRAERAANITIDNTLPEVRVDPLPAVVGGEDVLLSFHGTDNKGIESYDIQIKEGAGDWTFLRRGLLEDHFLFHGRSGSSYVFRVRARDRAGNFSLFTSHNEVHTVLDPTFPSITLLNFPLYAASTVSVSADVRADGGVSSVQFLLDGKPLTDFSSAPYLFSLNSSSYTEGWHSFTVKATDTQGKTSEIKRDFFVDLTAPAMVPLKLPSSVNAPFLISWQAEDNGVVASYDLDYQVAGGNWQSFLQESSKNSTVFGEGGKPVALDHPQTVAIRVRARDKAGNISPYVIASFFYSADAPYLEWESKITPFFVRDSFQRKLLASNNVAHVDILVDGEKNQTLASAPFQVTLSTASLAPYDASTCNQKDDQGRCFHILSATATSTKSIEGLLAPLVFLVDRTPPTVTFSVPEVSSSVFIPLKFTADDGQGSGVDKFVVEQKKGSQWMELVSTSSEEYTLFAPHGSRVQLRLKAIDKVGNVSDPIEKVVEVKAFRWEIAATSSNVIQLTLIPADTASSPPQVYVLQNGAPLREAPLQTVASPYVYEIDLVPNYDGPGKIYVGTGDAVFPFSVMTPGRLVPLSSPDGKLIVTSGQSQGSNLLYLIQNEGIFISEKSRGKELVFKQISPAYEIGPRAKSFDQPMALQYRYDPLEVLDPARLSFYEEVNGSWQYLKSKVSLFENKVETELKEGGKVAVFLDTLPPEAAVETPKEGSVSDDSTVNLKAVLSDIGSGPEASSVAIRVDGFPQKFKLEGETVSGSLGPLSGGNHNLEIQIKDKVGNMTLQKRSFSVKERELDLMQVFSYPNPSSGNLTFRVLLTKTRGVDVDIEIYNQQGRKIEATAFAPDDVTKGKKKVALFSLPNGVYFYRVKATDGNRTVQKVHKLVILK